MKKLILTTVFLAFAVSAFAAGTITFADESATLNGKRHIQITATCTADSSDGSYPVTKISPTPDARWLDQIKTYYGGTGPDDDTDLYILQGSNSGYDILNGGGVDRIDNATNNTFRPVIDGVPQAVMVFDEIWIKIINNTTNSAIVTIIMDFIEE
jgi:hypothetical protein